jgi:hypothetical protein
MPTVSTLRRHLPLLLATLLALRALVPAGYMLEAAQSTEQAAPGLVLSLCPLQNAGLDLAVLESSGAPTSHAGHHGHGNAHGADGAEVPELRGISDGCAAWVGSTSVDPGTGVTATMFALLATPSLMTAQVLPRISLAHYPNRARAPPSLSS